jgi:hypothetical protein
LRQIGSACCIVAQSSFNHGRNAVVDGCRGVPRARS